MKLININPQKTSVWGVVWGVYTSSFPTYERRGALSHENALNNELFHTKIVVDETDKFLALLFYWKYRDVIYIEHLAVNPINRGASIGTKVMQLLLEEHIGYKVILEIEPPVTEITNRRLKFYEKLGFKENAYEYTHPSYSRETFVHNLEILSYPKELNQLEYDEFCHFISTVVLTYID